MNIVDRISSLLCHLDYEGQLDSKSFLNWLDNDLKAEPDEKDRLKIKFEPNESDMPFESDLFVLIEGEYAHELLKQTVLTNPDFKKIATIPSTELGVSAHGILFKCNNILLTCLETDSNYSGEVTEILLPYAELAKNVATIQVRSIVEYKGVIPTAAKDDNTFLRGINSRLDYVKELQPPNMIDGVAAGIASWRSFKGQSVSCYIVFTRQILIDKECAVKIVRILKDLGIECNFSYTPKKRQSLGLYT